MKEDRPNGVFRLLGGQLNSGATPRMRDRRITDLDRIIKKWDIQGGGFPEVGINWSCLPRTQQLDSCFSASHKEVRTSMAHNKNENESIGKTRQNWPVRTQRTNAVHLLLQRRHQEARKMEFLVSVRGLKPPHEDSGGLSGKRE